MPVALAPVGLTGLNWADGEILAARAAQRFGVPFTLSTMSICSIEDVAGGGGQAVLVPALRDARPRLRRLAHRARQGGRSCSALVLTLDLQIQGQRHRDLKNGLAVPPKLTLGTALDIMTQARLGAERAQRASASRSATSRAASKSAKASPRSRNGSPASSTRRSRGRTSSG